MHNTPDTRARREKDRHQDHCRAPGCDSPWSYCTLRVSRTEKISVCYACYTCYTRNGSFDRQRRIRQRDK